jgi:hypothetical protein
MPFAQAHAPNSSRLPSVMLFAGLRRRRGARRRAAVEELAHVRRQAREELAQPAATTWPSLHLPPVVVDSQTRWAERPRRASGRGAEESRCNLPSPRSTSSSDAGAGQGCHELVLPLHLPHTPDPHGYLGPLRAR